jgi:hypothetical protein
MNISAMPPGTRKVLVPGCRSRAARLCEVAARIGAGRGTLGDGKLHE